MMNATLFSSESTYSSKNPTETLKMLENMTNMDDLYLEYDKYKIIIEHKKALLLNHTSTFKHETNCLIM